MDGSAPGPGDHAREDAHIEAMLRDLESALPRLQMCHADPFSLANAWAERHGAILAAASPAQRPAIARRLERIGIRWGLVPGVRVTREFTALGAAGRPRRKPAA